VCRSDEFVEAQWNKVNQVAELQKQFGCCVIHAGDLFDYWKPSPNLLSETIEHLPKKFYTVFGNHDLPQHNLELAYKSGVWTLKMAEVLEILSGYHWGQGPEMYPLEEAEEISINGVPIAVTHQMTYKTKLPYPGCTDSPARALLKRLSKRYRLIVTGHNHQTFTESLDGALLVNPGSLTRQTADQADHKPCVFLYYAKTNTVEPFYLKCEKGVVNRTHIEEEEQRNERICAFVSQLKKGEWDHSLSFEKNIEAYMNKNKIEKPIQDIVYKSIDNGKS
jgi:putative phosphoesterase